jgi:ATP-dependent Lon protease
VKLFRKDDPGQGRAGPAITGLRRRLAAATFPRGRPWPSGSWTYALGINRGAEYTIGLTYLEYLAALPWHRTTEDNLDLARAERILDGHHYGLGQVKERILEHLAIKALRRKRQSRVLAVDDDETARRNLVLALAREAAGCHCGQFARRSRCSRLEFDVLLTDLRLGQSDGIARPTWPLAGHARRRDHRLRLDSVGVDAMEAFSTWRNPCDRGSAPIVRRALEARAAQGTRLGALFRRSPGTGHLGRPGVAQARAVVLTISLGDSRRGNIRGHRRTYAGAGPPIEEICRVSPTRC